MCFEGGHGSEMIEYTVDMRVEWCLTSLVPSSTPSCHMTLALMTCSQLTSIDPCNLTCFDASDASDMPTFVVVGMTSSGASDYLI